MGRPMSAVPPERPRRPLSTPGNPVARLFAWLLAALLVRLSTVQRFDLGMALGGWAFRLGIRRRVALENLAHAFPEWSEAQRQALAARALGQMAVGFLDGFVGERLGMAGMASSIATDGAEAIRALLAPGRGAVLAAAHFGSWELGIEGLCARAIPASVVVKPLRGAFNAQLVRSRTASGLQLLHARGAVESGLEAVSQGRLLYLLIDQAIAPSHGVAVPFFGRPAWTTPGASLIAVKAGVEVFVGLPLRERDGIRWQLEGPIPVPTEGSTRARVAAHTALLTAALERSIRARPEQWMWSHRRWKHSGEVAPNPP